MQWITEKKLIFKILLDHYFIKFAKVENMKADFFLSFVKNDKYYLCAISSSMIM